MASLLSSIIHSIYPGGSHKNITFDGPPSADGSPVATRIDFSKYPGLEEYAGTYALVIDNAFTVEECENLVQEAEASTTKGWEVAQINVGGDRQITNTSYRNSGRIMWDSHDTAGYILDRIRPYLADVELLDGKDEFGHTVLGYRGRGLRETSKWQLTTLNERLRFLKYEKGQYFKPHCDGPYGRPDNSEISFLTLQLYCNESVGGSTRFWPYDRFREPDPYGPCLDIEPKVGRVLVFQHRLLQHSGESVQSGVKISIRTDFMFKMLSEEEEPEEEEKENDHGECWLAN